MGALDFLVMGLATWRIASLLVAEDGPWKVFANLRKWLGTPQEDPPVLGAMLKCIWCTSFWVAIGVLAVTLLGWGVLLVPFALSAGAAIVDRLVNSGDAY